MRKVRGDIQKVLAGKNATAKERSDRIGKIRAGAVVAAAAEPPPSILPGIVLEHGGLTHHLEWVRPELVDGAETAIRVRPYGAIPSGDDDVVVINPPILVRDSQGDVAIDGVRFREDPLAALAEVLTRHLGGRA